MLSRTRRCGNRAYSWNRKPTGRRCGFKSVQSSLSKTTRPELSLSRPAIQRSTVVFPEPEGPNRIVIDASSEIRMEASTRGPPSNCLTISAVSSKEPPLSIESIDDREDDERDNQQHR